MNLQIQYDEDWVFSSAQCVESCRGENFDYAVANQADLSCNCMQEVNLTTVHPYSCEDTHPFEVTSIQFSFCFIYKWNI